MVVAAIAVAGAGAWLALRDDSPSEPPAFLSPCGTVVHAEGPTRVRLLLIGDSIMAQPSCDLAAVLAPLGVETHMHAVSGSGLLTGAVNWPRTTERLVAAVDPDVVLAIFVGNYVPPPVLDFAGNPIEADTAAFFDLWRARASEVSRLVQDAGAKLFWVEPPPMLSDRAARLYDGYRTLGDGTLPSGRVFGGDAGQWVDTKPACGDGPLRTSDSVHLTDLGIQVFARAIAHDLSVAIGLPPVPPPCG